MQNYITLKRRVRIYIVKARVPCPPITHFENLPRFWAQFRAQVCAVLDKGLFFLLKLIRSKVRKTNRIIGCTLWGCPSTTLTIESKSLHGEPTSPQKLRDQLRTQPSKGQQQQPCLRSSKKLEWLLLQMTRERNHKQTGAQHGLR